MRYLSCASFCICAIRARTDVRLATPLSARSRAGIGSCPATHSRNTRGRCRAAAVRAMVAGCALCVAACGAASNPAETGVQLTDSAGTQLVHSLDRRADTLRMELVEELRIGGAAAGEDEIFHFIRGLVTDADGRIFVIDDGSHAIRLFDTDGRFVRRIGGRGSGPGEFESVNLLTLWRDTLYVLDLRRWTATFFDTTGALLAAHRIMREDGTVLQPLAGGPAGWYASQDSPFRRPPLEVGVEQRLVQSLVRFDPRRLASALTSVGAADTLVTPVVSYQWSRSFGFIGSEGGGTQGVFGSSPLFEPRGTRAIDGRGFVYITPGWPLVVDVYDTDGAHVRRLSRAHDTIPVDDELVDEVVRRARSHFDTLGARGASGMNSLNARVKMPRVGYVPTVTSMLVSADGWLWLRRRDLEPDPVLLEWSRGAPRPPAYWDVFDPEGRYHHTLRMPDRFTPRAIAPDHAVGVQRDELDVETVVRFAIRPRPAT